MSETVKRSGDSSELPSEAPDADESSREPEARAGLLAELLEARSEAKSSASQPAPRTRIGKLVEWSSGQAPRVEFEGNELGPLPARSTIVLDPNTILAAIQDERGVLLSFEDGKPNAPIITGLLQVIGDFDEPAEIWDDEDGTDPTREADPASESELLAGESLAGVEARVDGRRVEIEAADEIVLRCGKASIVLRRNGRVVIRGTYVETRSRGVNRIKGGSVEIN